MPKGDTYVVPKREALTREAALVELAAKDPRPMLVLRECAVCNKTDDALLKPSVDNEKTLFLARWFHCVKLPVDVLSPDHPFHALFPGKGSEHLFVCAADGSGKVPLESDTSRVELWSAMDRVAAAAYGRSPLAAYQALQKSLERLDEIDARIAELEAREAELLEKPGVPRAKLAKAAGDLAKSRKQRDELRAEVERATRPALAAAPPAPASPAVPAGAGGAGSR